MLPHCAVDPGVENDKSEQGNECGEEEIHVLFVDLGRKQVEEVLRTKGTPEQLVIILNNIVFRTPKTSCITPDPPV